MSIAEIIGIIFGSGVLSAVITAVATRRKNNADADNTISEAWSKLIEPMQAQLDKNGSEIASLKNKIADLECSGREKDKTIAAQNERIQELTDEVAELRKQLEDIGQKPKTKKAKGD